MATDIHLPPSTAGARRAYALATSPWPGWDELPQPKAALIAENLQFLMHVAVLPHMTADLAAALSGRRDAPQLLECLHQSDAYIERIGVPDGYVLEPAFRRSLMACARSAFTEQKMHDLVDLAAASLAQRGMVTDAFDIYAEDRQWPAAAALLAAHSPALLRAGHAAALNDCIGRIAPAFRATDAACQYWLGRSLPASSLGERLLAYESACALYDAVGDVPWVIMSLSEIVMLLCQSEVGSTRASDSLHRLEGLVSRHVAALDHYVRLAAYTALTRGMHLSDFVGYVAHRWVVRLAQLLAGSEEGDDRIRAATTLLRFYVHFGFAGRAQAIIAQCEQQVAGELLSPLTIVWWNIACGQHYFVSGRRDASLLVLDIAHQCARAASLEFVTPTIVIHKLYTCLGGGDVATAADYIAHLEQIIHPQSVFEQAFYSGALAWYALLRNRATEALPHAQAMFRLAGKLLMPAANGYALLVLTATQIGCGDLASAEKLFKQLRDNELMYKNDLFAPHVRLIGARLAIERGEQQRSIDSLRAGFLAAKESQVLAPIFWLPNVMSDLCARALEHGVEIDFITVLIRRRNLVPSVSQSVETWPWPLRIYALGAFSIFREGDEIVFSGKTQRKPLELLKALVALGGDGVDLLILTHLLWPEAEGDAAQRSFHSTLHRLRKLIGCDDAIALTDRKVSLNTALCWVDVWEFERIVERESLADREQLSASEWNALHGQINRVLALYRSDFLVLDEVCTWILPMRDRLRSRFLRFVTSVGDFMERTGNHHEAAALYQRGLDMDCLVEEFYRRLMECRQRQGRVDEAIAVYQRCREIFSIVLGIAPSDKTTAWHRALLAAQAAGAGTA